MRFNAGEVEASCWDELSSTRATIHSSHCKEAEKAEPLSIGSTDSGIESVVEEYTLESATSEVGNYVLSRQSTASVVSSVDLVYYSNASFEENELISDDDDNSSYMELTVDEDLDVSSEDEILEVSESESRVMCSSAHDETLPDNTADVETAKVFQEKKEEHNRFRSRRRHVNKGFESSLLDWRSTHSAASGSFSLQLSQSTSISGLTENPQDASIDDSDIINEIKVEIQAELSELRSDLKKRLLAQVSLNPMVMDSDKETGTSMVHELRSSGSSWKSESLSPAKSCSTTSIAASIENPQDGSSPKSSSSFPEQLSAPPTMTRTRPTPNAWAKVVPKPRMNPRKSRRSWSKCENCL